jgi:hypothetical protein
MIITDQIKGNNFASLSVFNYMCPNKDDSSTTQKGNCLNNSGGKFLNTRQEAKADYRIH